MLVSSWLDYTISRLVARWDASSWSDLLVVSLAFGVWKVVAYINHPVSLLKAYFSVLGFGFDMNH